MYYCPDCLKPDCECPPVSIKIAALMARAEKAEAELAVRREQMHRLPICGGCMGKYRECQACRADQLQSDLARAVEERDDYRAKAIQRQRDFDGAAHACDVLQGKLDKVTEERDAALVLLKTLGAEHGRAWLSTASETAFNLLRERGLLEGER